jgi:DNA (cytosine-5)-methyltransferase 1
MMKVVDLFCGCGGMALGFQQAGFEIVYALDFDKYAVQSYRHNVGSHVIQGDIREVKSADIPTADVWTFGFPCQDLSVAGKQAGMKIGTRSGLFYEVMRLLDERTDKPEIIMAENVKGLKPYLNIVEEEFAKRGYKMKYHLYNSKYWGVPQNRERYYVVGYLDKEVDLPRERKDWIPKLSNYLDDVVDEKYFLNRSLNLTVSNKNNEPNIKVAGMLDMLGKDQIRRVHDPEGISPTITAVQGGHHHVKILAERGRPDGDGYRVNREFRNDELTNTISRNPQLNYLYKDLRVRRLTPREYARLQGFPETYEIVVSDTQAYKQFGNSVTVPLVKAIAEAIKNTREIS